MAISLDPGVQSPAASSASYNIVSYSPTWLFWPWISQCEGLRWPRRIHYSHRWAKFQSKERHVLASVAFESLDCFKKRKLCTDCYSWGKELLKTSTCFLVAFYSTILSLHCKLACKCFVLLFPWLFRMSLGIVNPQDNVCFSKKQPPILTIKGMDDFTKPSMFCRYAQAIKQASMKQLLALTLSDYWEQTECSVQSKRY